MAGQLFSDYFYFRTIRKLLVVFTDLFKGVQVLKNNQAGTTEIERVVVPISFGQKEKWFDRNKQDPNLTRSIEVSLPRMSVEFNGLSPDSSRRMNNLNYFKSNGPGGKFFQQYTPQPYDFKFSLYVQTRNTEDWAQIIEQILPSFRPDYTPKLDLDSKMGIKVDVPFILDNDVYTSKTEGDYESMRYLEWELNFTVKGWLYQQVTDPPVILQANTNIYDASKSFFANVIGLDMKANGFANYAKSEIVFQGSDVGSSSASANVVNWDYANKILYIDSSVGIFTPNVIVIGDSTGATWNLGGYSTGLQPVEKSIIVPNPITANGQGPYGYTVTITENLGAP